MNTLLLNKGQVYTLRNGLKTSPLRLSKNGTLYIYEAEVIEHEHNEPSVFSWTATGKYLTKDV